MFEALASTVKREELLDPELPLDGLVWRLFNEEIGNPDHAEFAVCPKAAVVVSIIFDP